MPAKQVNRGPTLADLLQGFAVAPAIPVRGISSDSRTLGSGDVFFACGGAHGHGLDFVDDALAAGVAAIAWDAATAAAPDVDVGVPFVAVSGLAHHLGEIANRFFDRPSEAMRVTGVTGTNGKTTVAWLMARSREQLGDRCGYLGTLGSGVGDIDAGSGMTTPGAIELHGTLAEFRAAGAAFAAIEVSSHALAQNRVDGIAFDTVMFTNLSREHLDYHGDMKNYAAAKAKLFLECRANSRIVNVDSAFGAELAGRCGRDVVTVSTRADLAAGDGPFVCVRSVVARDRGSLVRFASSWGDGEFELALPGDFNIANATLVLAALLQQGVPLANAGAALGTLSAPPGRMQRVAAADGLPVVIVDYAHTPEALEVALCALRAHCQGLLWCVFGCGGDRDPGKRPQMGRIAERHADRVVVTSDNPRSEKPWAIIDDVTTGLERPERAKLIADRAAAIGWAINSAAANDVVLIAGKGHENYQLLADGRIEFSDQRVAEASLAKRAGGGR